LFFVHRRCYGFPRGDDHFHICKHMLAYLETTLTRALQAIPYLDLFRTHEQVGDALQ